MVATMNATAASLGMIDTHFVDCTGLSSENVASPEDLSKLVIAAAQNPTIKAYSTDSHYAVNVGRHRIEYHSRIDGSQYQDPKYQRLCFSLRQPLSGRD